MRILALEPFYGGSHRAFIDGWMAHSRHEFSLLTLPDSHWKWRMRHAAIALAEGIQQRTAAGETWDLIWASDMLNLAELRGLLPGAAGRLPAILYFHENQLTYPVREQRQRDLHFAFTNFISCCAADAVWFNSRFHLSELLSAFGRLLDAMPDRQPRHLLPSIEARSSVQSPGVDIAARLEQNHHEPLRIVWAARWEHDKILCCNGPWSNYNRRVPPEEVQSTCEANRRHGSNFIRFDVVQLDSPSSGQRCRSLDATGPALCSAGVRLVQAVGFAKRRYRRHRAKRLYGCA